MTGRIPRRGRWSMLAAAAFTLSGTLTACSSSSDNVGSDAEQTIRFVWWGNEDRAEATKKVVALFEKEHPNIKVQTEFSGYPAYVQKLTTQIAGGAAPDLLQLDRPTFGEYQQKRQLADLSPYVGKSLKTEKIPASLLAGGKADEGQYAMPAGLTTELVVYDEKLFAKAGVSIPEDGWTWDQFAADMTKVQNKTGRAGASDFGWSADLFEAWLHQQGKALYASKEKLGFSKDDLAKYWNMLGSMRQKKALTSPEVTTKSDGSVQNSPMVAKESASETSYDSGVSSYVSSYQGGSIGLAPLPSDNKAASGMPALPPVYYGVSQRSSHKEAATLLLDFLVNDAEASTILGTTRGTPPNSDNKEAVCAQATGPDKQTCSFQTKVADRLMPSDSWFWPSGSAALKSDFQRVYDDVIFGKSSVSAGAAKVVENAEQGLSR
ncbi:ABC transporter substrate-binding protein [Streptomyces sp. NBC_00059]|uniref:ABC transporter substrate-binding protein n=1 Tax=Streptomyces sp. NBC_00059 TaxID=2975635 RepID=UPI00225717A2|nr:extracellular solute-binding protein [Streptomyces sp. NBC_00059]MCX5415956.1 extracellular solute-binding protein [Streptomyces sp. NBC_00059]